MLQVKHGENWKAYVPAWLVRASFGSWKREKKDNPITMGMVTHHQARVDHIVLLQAQFPLDAQKKEVTMNEEKGKFSTLKEILLSSRTDYQGKLRYLALLFNILIVSLVFWIIYDVSIHVSRQTFQHTAFVGALFCLLLLYVSARYERQKESKKPNCTILVLIL